MKRLTVLLWFLATVAVAQNSILVTPQWVKEQQSSDPKLVVLQSNFLRLDFEREHLPGAQFLWRGWLAPDSPDGSFNAPDPAKASEILSSLGISNDSKVVLCHVSNDVSPTARMFLTLENLGLKGQVYFLNGGLEAWKKEGYPVTQEVSVAKKGKFKATPGALLVDKDYVKKAISSNGSVVVDARMKNYYDGEPTGNPRDGHIANARNIPYPDLLDAANLYKFKPDDKLQEYFTPVVPDKTKEVVTYCFIGQTASVVYLASRILGYPVKLYDGSMQEWSRIPELPMEVTKK